MELMDWDLSPLSDKILENVRFDMATVHDPEEVDSVIDAIRAEVRKFRDRREASDELVE
ncbi:hypothetical protein [Novipirellula artificiosorum]|uniref:Uncharacterized protein n=1 Tax=Novipirellula artificiosorum TaxID=2528016 RepID=A0A5C6D1G6_9BACT|nr:hypothetical protein [Novipirellula artificiosorum]TWU29046.1 hypothetical protein Poly41_67450 [Novipirellula artificiosorum]